MDDVTIEDLAFGICSFWEPDGVGRRVCLSVASYAAAEKSEWRMALKILWGTNPSPKPFPIMYLEMHTYSIDNCR
jgi:hypothetical protein